FICDANRDATSSISVDFPTPGSPPRRISAPATTPPPRTRSNSAMPVGVRGASAPTIASNATGIESHVGRAFYVVGVERSSTKEFHSWHVGHRPIHFVDMYTHCWQAYCVLAFVVLTDI